MSTQIFISYRRTGGDITAKLVCEALKNRGFSVFYDYDALKGGFFDQRIYQAIEECSDVVLILPQGALDRCINDDDWVRQELRYALKLSKNIIPVMLDGFEFPQDLPSDIADIRFCNGVRFMIDYFDAFIDKVVERLVSSTAAQEGVPPKNGTPDNNHNKATENQNFNNQSTNNFNTPNANTFNNQNANNFNNTYNGNYNANGFNNNNFNNSNSNSNGFNNNNFNRGYNNNFNNANGNLSSMGNTPFIGNMIVTRPLQYSGAVRKIKILVDGAERDGIGTGKSLTLPLTAGMHTVEFKIDWLSEKVVVNISESHPETVIEVKFKTSLLGKLDVRILR